MKTFKDICAYSFVQIGQYVVAQSSQGEYTSILPFNLKGSENPYNLECRPSTEEERKDRSAIADLKIAEYDEYLYDTRYHS